MRPHYKKKSFDFSLLAFFIFSLGYQFLFYRHGLNLWDEGVIYGGVYRIMDGQIVNRDFFGYPPGQYYLPAFFFKLFGPSIEIGRLMWIPLTSLMASACLLISRKLINGKWVWVPPIFLLAAPSMYYNRVFPLFVVINLYFLFRLTEGINLRSFASALFSAASTLFFLRKRSASSLFS